ncbi:Mitochondrial presequence protease [Elasticomyces elasticus]|nr:Mitochondrial presequence protease [Elasticomyces elasticus]
MLRAVRLPALRLKLYNTYQQCVRGYASVTDLAAYPKPGTQLHGFTLKRAEHVPELELTAIHLQHDKTGADYLHVARDDKNNVFSIGFKTNPPDATGVPHILEHTTLCGSEKYPVRDPFFKMLPRSLSNFMNAFTSADHTSYPFATTNAQDFKNLMSVYLDATLHPLLNQNDFTQEGWRIGPENPLAVASGDGQDTDARKLVFKGVVYNEMKGQMSDASYLYYIRFQDHIFPAINNSGGDPQKMTDLTYEQLRKFHADHYHPSNAKLFTYGDMPLSEHLQEIGQRLDRFEKVRPDNDIKSPIDLCAGPSYISVKGPFDPLVPENMQYKTSTSWMTGDTTNILESFSMRVISSLLMDGYGSPLYRALIETGLGPDFSPNTGYDNSAKKGIFSVGLNGVKADDVPKVKQAIHDTLSEVKQKGFDSSKVDGILHQLELGLKHKTAAFGMGVMQRLTPSWFNGVDPFDALAWTKTVDAFKAEYARGGYLEGLLEKYLLNDNTLTFTMEPSSTYAQELAEEEASRLASKISQATEQYSSTEEAQEHLQKREMELLEEQEKGRSQNLDCLPTVHVKDIPRVKEKTIVRDSSVDTVKVQWREAPTNGLTYFRAVTPFKNVPDTLRELIPLFCDSVMRIGTKDKSMEQLEDLIKLKTGGLSFGYHASTSPHDISRCEEGLSFSGYALDRNVAAMYELLQTLLVETDFSSMNAQKMIRELLQSSSSGAINSIAESGHSYARRYAEAGLTPQGRLSEQTGGLTQVKLITSLASNPELDLETNSGSQTMSKLITNLKLIQSLIIASLRTARVALTCGAEASHANESHLARFLSSTTSTISTSASDLLNSASFPPPKAYPRTSKSFFPLPYQVYYSALSLPTVPYTDHSGAPLAILAQLLTHKHLHHEIREKGGAYGGGAYSRALNGVFGFYSYRDPNPLNTIKIMSDAGRWAAEREWTERDLEEAKLSVFQSLDAPESVSQEGMVRFLSGVDEVMEQSRREQLLDVTREQVRSVAEKHLIAGIPDGNLAVLGEKKDWVKEGDGWRIEDVGMAKAVHAGEDE